MCRKRKPQYSKACQCPHPSQPRVRFPSHSSASPKQCCRSKLLAPQSLCQSQKDRFGTESNDSLLSNLPRANMKLLQHVR